MAFYHIISNPESKTGFIAVEPREKAVNPQVYNCICLEVLDASQYASSEGLYWYISRMYAGFSFRFIELD